MKYILFDLDGTVTDSKIGILKSADYALRHFGIETENLDDIQKFIGPPLHFSFTKIFNLSEEETIIAIEKYRERYSKLGIYENTLYIGIVELLKELKANGKKVILATSKPKFYADKILNYFDITGYFDFVAGSEMDGSRSEKAEVISYALENMGIADFSECVMIGDREHDIIGAKSIGVASIGVLYGYGSRGELEKAGADRIASTVQELSVLIK